MKFLILMIIGGVLLSGCGDDSRHTQKPESATEAPTPKKDRWNYPLSQSISPCDDFYQHVCSETMRTRKIREDRKSLTPALHDYLDLLIKKRKEYLNRLAAVGDKSSLSKVELTLANYYQSCVSTKLRKKAELKYIKRLLNEVAQLDEQDIFNRFLARQVSGEHLNYVDFVLQINQDKPQVYDLIIRPKNFLSLRKSLYEKKEVVNGLFHLMDAFFQLEVIEKALKLNDAKRKAIINDVLALESRFAKFYPTKQHVREMMKAKAVAIDKEAFNNRYPHFHLTELLAQLPDESVIRDLNKEVFLELNQLLGQQKGLKFSLEVFKAHYLYRSLSNLITYSYPEFKKRVFSFAHKYVGGPKKPKDVQEECTVHLTGLFHAELDWGIYPELFADFDKQKFSEFTKKIVTTGVVGVIKRNEWLSDEGKKKILEKLSLDYLKLELGRPDEKKNWPWQVAVKTVQDNFVHNEKSFKKAKLRGKINSLKFGRSLSRWWYSPLKINATYAAWDNKFLILMGMIHPPFYFPTHAHDHENYGAIGSIIGHEIGHGIDDRGGKYDKLGVMKKWFPEPDQKQFDQRKKVLIRQFSRLNAGGHWAEKGEKTHNGHQVIGEALSDLVGLEFAYETAFPGGKGSLAHKKEFFTSFARMYCTKYRPGERDMRIERHVHPLFAARANGALRNMDSFQQVFNCREGDEMFLPEEKRAKIW